MTTVLQVTQGHDQGREFAIGRDSVRIGNDPTVDVRLNDPQLNGTLTVSWQNGTYHIQNNLSFPIYLDRKPLQEGENKVWYDGVTVQPTASTTLILKSSDGQGLDSRESAVREITDGTPTSEAFIKTMAGVGIVTGLGILLMAVKTVDYASPEDIFATSIKIFEALESEHTPTATHEEFNIEWKRLGRMFREARLADRSGDPEAAKSFYYKCSQIRRVQEEYRKVENFPTLDSNSLKTLERVDKVINQRKQQLSN